MTEKAWKHPMGAAASDTVTNFEGRITGRTEYSTGCRQYCLTPEVDKDGNLRDSNWFDEERLKVLLFPPAPSSPAHPPPSGGPQSSEAPKK